jgi:hypothetical protein
VNIPSQDISARPIDAAADTERTTKRTTTRSRRSTNSTLTALAGAVAASAALVAAVIGSTPACALAAAASTTTAPSTVSMPLVTAPATAKGPEGIAVPKGSTLASLATAATGQSVDGIQCQTNEQFVSHVHSHLTIFVNGQAKVVPAGVGIPDPQAVQTKEGPFVQSGNCFYWLHTHAKDGVIHIESPSASRHFTLGQFFDEWGQPLSATSVGPATGTVTAFLNGKVVHTNPRNIPLGAHNQIQLDVGTPIVAPVKVKNWGQL